MNNFTFDSVNAFQNPLDSDMERNDYNRRRAQALCATFLYDVDPGSKQLVDANPDVRAYAHPTMRTNENMHLIGRELALVADTPYADMPMDLARRAVERVTDESRRERLREALALIGRDGNDTADSYYGFYAQVQRDTVRGEFARLQQEQRERQESLTRMDSYVRGDRPSEDGSTYTMQDLANVRAVMEPETMDNALAVRDFMLRHVRPMDGEQDAERIMRTLDGLEGRLFDVIGDNPQRAEMVYGALMHWAEQLKQSDRVGIDDEFVVAVGKKLSNWSNPQVRAALSITGAVGPAGAINPGQLSSTASSLQQAAAESEERRMARSILRAAINKGLEAGTNESWWHGTLRAVSQMAGETSTYMVPVLGQYLGTADVLVGGIDTADQMQLKGLTGEQAAGQSIIETGVGAAVELMPWGRVGGRGLSGFLRHTVGEAVQDRTVGRLSRWAVRATQSSTGRAMAAEIGANFVDEALLEPIASGIATYGAEQTFDMFGWSHGRSREFLDSFDELAEIWGDPKQIAALMLFSAGLAGAGAYGINQNVRYWAENRKFWEASGLTPEQVDRVMASDNIAAEGKRMVDEGWLTDPAGMRERRRAACQGMADRGEVLVLTGEGALDAELEEGELQEAYRAVWQEYVNRGILPSVQAVGGNRFRIIQTTADGKPSVDITLDARQADAYLQHALDEADVAETEELQKRTGKKQYVDLREEIGSAMNVIAGNAAMRSVEAKSEQTGIQVDDITRGLPDFIAQPIKAKGYVTLADAQNITEWAIGRINGLIEGGTPESEAKATKASNDGMARTLGDWSTFARDFAHRERMEGLKRGEGAISVSRTRNRKKVMFNGLEVLGQTMMTVPGHVRMNGAVEDVTESFVDMMIQERAAVLLGDKEATMQERADAEADALNEMAGIVREAREAVQQIDPSADIEEVKDGDKMSVIEALSTMATSNFLASAVTPKWMRSLQAALRGNLETADALHKVRSAYAAALQQNPEQVGQMDEMLSKLGVYVQDVFREARIEAVDVQAWKTAQAIAGARADGPSGSGGAPVSAVKQEAEENEAEIVRNERQEEPEPEVKVSPTQEAEEAREVLQQMAPAGNAPADMKGVFVDDQCYYNQAGGFWCGMIRKSDLRDGTEQVKIGQKGKHGVIAGKELTGRFQHSVGAIYVWRRKNGELQVISGRHRFAKLMEDEQAEYCNAYVFNEDEAHDERWARMLDYENNMRDDQADELTAATYVRETGLTDAELKDRGLMRNGTRCKRGALIGRFSRQELWTRFKNGVIEPKDAEIICNLTRNISRQERIEEIQTRCCMLLEAKKSWEFIGGMVQLMANKEMVTMKQGLLDFGADFEADLARAAEWIERNIKAINESITLLKQGKKLSGKKREEAERLGITTATQEGAEEMLRDLEMLKGQFELIGSYPDLVAQAQMWDGKTEVDPVGRYLEQAREEREQAAAEGEMDADEYLAEQARKEAAEAVPSLFGVTMEMGMRKVEGDVTFNVIGPSAANWDKYPDSRKFKGRDDGKERVEIDASGAKIKGFPNTYPVQDVMRKLIHAGVYDREEHMVYSSLSFIEDITREERGETKLSETELKEDCDKYPDLAEDVEPGLKAAGLTWESKVLEARGACFTALSKWKQTLEKELERMNIEKPTGEAWHALVEQKPGLATVNAGKRAVSVWSGKWLDDVLDFPELYEAYPELRNIQLAEDFGLGSANASYSEFAKWHFMIVGRDEDQYPLGFINMNPNSSSWGNEREALSIILHEVQHAIQGIEGFAKGGNTRSVRQQVKDMLEGSEAKMAMLERDLRWFSAVDIARDLLKEARMLRRYPNAWKRSGRRFEFARMSDSADEIREKILRDIAERYRAFREDDTAETQLLDMPEYVLPAVQFHSMDGIEAGLAALDKLPSRKLRFRGTAAKKGRKLTELQKRSQTLKKVLAEFEWEPYQLYRRLAGEIESRNVQTRMDWTAEEREARPFNDTLEYPGEAIVSFSVIGPSAKTWTKYVDRAFAGRDDGKMRAEIDASGARLKWEDLRGRNVAAYRRIVDDWYKLPDEECKVIEAYAELYYDWQDELLKLNSTSEEDAAYFEVYRAVAKLRTELNEKRDGVRKLLGKWFVERGGGAAVMVNADNALVDEIAGSLWGPYMDGKVADELDLQPLRHGGMALQDVLAYDELYEAYPELAQLRVETVKMESARGCVRSSDGQHIIQINKNLEGEWAQFFSTLMHEVQHVIQDIEGFAKGGNPQSARDAAGNYKRRYEIQNECARLRLNIAWLEGYDVARREFLNIGDAISMREDKEKLQDLRDKYNNLAYQYNKGAIAEPGFNGEDGRDSSFVIPMLSGVTKSAYAKAQKAWDKTQDRKAAFPGLLERLRARYDVLWAEFSELDKQQQRWGALSSHELYLRLAGEIEARNVQQRVRMTADERLATPFNETLEYPGEALVTYNMERVQANWEATLKRFLAMPPVAGTPAYERDINVCPTPAVMQMVGARGLDLVISPHVLVKCLDEDIVLGNGKTIREMYGAEDEDQGKHKILLSDLQKLTYALANPICIAVSEKSRSIEIVTELKEGDKNILVAVRLDTIRTGQRHQRVNRINSLYGKNKIEKILSHQMLYWDNEKARRWTGDRGLQLPTVPYPERAYGGSVYTPYDLVKYKMRTGLSFSMERASMRALDVLRGRADERAGETLIKDWQRACEAWGQLAGTGEGYLGKGAKTLGEMQALIGATKGVLPEKYCRMGHLNGLMRWAGIYARMQQNGELPRAGVINGPIYQKFVERLQKGDELNRVQGMSEEEAKEALASLAGERLEVAMLKVANECRRRLELFLKDREKERIDWIVEKAYPNRQAGKAWPRGKMAAEAYRRMELAYKFMRMQPDDLAEFIKGIKNQLNELEPSDEEYEAKEAKLEDELFLAQTFGAWDNMSFVQARRASGAMAEIVLAGRNEWQSKLREERRRAEFVRRQIASHFKTSTKDMIGKRTGDAAKEKADKLTLGQSIARGGMSYSQLMLALEGKLGKEFTSRHIRMIAKAHQEIQRFNQERQRWMFKTLAKITGLKTEGEIEEWINGNNEIFDTGIVLTPTNVTQCVLTPDEAEMWLAMTAEEREERRRQLQEEARSKGQEPDNIPDEAQMEELRQKLEASEKNGTTPREYVLRREHRIKQPLHCTKEALLYAILTFEQDDYKRLMDVNGISEEQLAKMRELVGPKLLAWGYAMREKLNEHGQHMAELYEAYTGVPFASRQNYFRGVFDTAIAKDNGEAIDVQNAITGGKYGVLVPRQYHNLKINWNTSATQVGLSTLNQQQNYISTAHITREWRTLLANPVFEKRMRAEIGDAAANMIQSWTKLIDGAVITDAKTQRAFKNFLGKILGFYAISRLAGNVYTIVKQASALLNGLVGGRVPTSIIEGNAIKQQLVYRHIGIGEYLWYLAKAMIGRTEITWQEVEQADYIAGRMSVEGHNLEQAAMLAPGQKVPSKLGRAGRTVSEKSMEAIGWADRESNTEAALAIAEAVYQQAKAENKDGMVPDAELRRVAIETAGLMIELAAQPQLRTQKNYWAASGALGVLGDFFFMFKSEALGKMGVYIAQMFNGNHKAWLAGWLSFGVANALLLALIDYMRGYGPDDDDDDFWTRQLGSILLNTLFQDVSSLPVLGDVPAYLKSQILGEREWKSSLVDMVLPIRDIWSAGQREVKNIQRGRELEAHVTALCSLARAVGAGGGWVANSSRVPIGTCAELALAAAAISNVVRFGKDVVKFLTED